MSLSISRSMRLGLTSQRLGISLTAITGIPPSLAQTTTGGNLSDFVTWGSATAPDGETLTGASPVREMNINGAGWAPYVGATALVDLETAQIRETWAVVGGAVPARTFSSALRTAVYVAPVAGTLAAVSETQGTGTPTVSLAVGFTGQALGYTSNQPWATVSGSTLTIADEVRTGTVRITAENSGGTAFVDLSVTIAAPVVAVISPIADQSFAQNSGDVTIDLNTVFTNATSYIVTGAGASVSDSTLTLNDNTLRTGVTITVTGSNAFNSAQDAFTLTITEAAVPPVLTEVTVGAYNSSTDTIPVAVEGTNIAAGQTATVVIQPQADAANGPNPVATFTGPLSGTGPFTLNFTVPIGIPFAVYRAHVSIAGSAPFASNTFALDTIPATLINPMASLSGADINAAVASSTARGMLKFGLRLASSPVLSEETLRAGSGAGLVSFASIEAANANTHTFASPQPGTYRVDFMQVNDFGIASAVITAGTSVVIASGPLFVDSFDTADGYTLGDTITVTSANWDRLADHPNVTATVNPLGIARIFGDSGNQNLRVIYTGAVTSDHEIEATVDEIIKGNRADPTLLVRASGATVDNTGVRAFFRTSDNTLILSQSSNGTQGPSITVGGIVAGPGDVLTLRVSGTTATVLRNGTLVATLTGITITGGKPGWGAFLGTNVTNRVSFSSIEVDDI